MGVKCATLVGKSNDAQGRPKRGRRHCWTAGILGAMGPNEWRTWGRRTAVLCSLARGAVVSGAPVPLGAAPTRSNIVSHIF